MQLYIKLTVSADLERRSVQWRLAACAGIQFHSARLRSVLLVTVTVGRLRQKTDQNQSKTDQKQTEISQKQA